MILYDDIKFYPSGNGYLKSSDGKWLHRYIWEKYNGEIPDGYIIHHKDHNKNNNNIDNLELMLEFEHRKEHSPNKNNKITKELYFKILNLYNNGYNNSEIQKITGKCSATIYDCIKGRRNKKYFNEYYKLNNY